MSMTITRNLFYVSLAIVFCDRLFLLVKSFISFRSLLEGTFKTTLWDDNWPHV